MVFCLSTISLLLQSLLHSRYSRDLFVCPLQSSFSLSSSHVHWSMSFVVPFQVIQEIWIALDRTLCLMSTLQLRQSMLVGGLQEKIAPVITHRLAGCETVSQSFVLVNASNTEYVESPAKKSSQSDAPGSTSMALTRDFQPCCLDRLEKWPMPQACALPHSTNTSKHFTVSRCLQLI